MYQTFKPMKREPEYELDFPSVQKKQLDNHNNSGNTSRGDLSNFVKNKKCIELLHKKGVKSLFPIQYCTFDHIMEGKDIIARDRTGSGKTLAFSLPVILRMRENRSFEKNHLVKFLIVLPTRELTIQVKDQIQSLRFKDQPDYRIIAVYGKSDINYQIQKIQQGIDIIVATPGRLIDLLQRDVVKMNQMQVLCLDQADQMLKLGFKQDIEKIYKYIRENAPKKTQNLLFSATIPSWLQQISKMYLNEDRKYVNLIKNEDRTTPATLIHYSIKLSDDDMKVGKSRIICNIINQFAVNSGNVIIFCQRKADAMNLSNRLNDQGKFNQALHGDVPQSKRQNAYRKFKQGTLKILVATNVAARGLDFPDIDLVIQVEPPNNPEPYIHRSGRTARKGKEGCCVTLFTYSTERHIKNIEREGKIDFKRLRVQDFLGKSKPREREREHKEIRRGNQDYGQQIELFMKFIPKQKSESQIRDYLESKRIDFRSVRLLKDQDGMSKGCAFIKFNSNEHKNRCINLDGESWSENRITFSEPNKR